MNLHIQIYNDKGEVEHSEKSIEDMIEYLQVLNGYKTCFECDGTNYVLDEDGNKTFCNCVKDKAILGISPDKGCEY